MSKFKFKQLSLAALCAAAISASASAEPSMYHSETMPSLSDVTFTMAPATAQIDETARIAAKQRANEVALGVLMGWLETQSATQSPRQ